MLNQLAELNRWYLSQVPTMTQSDINRSKQFSCPANNIKSFWHDVLMV